MGFNLNCLVVEGLTATEVAVRLGYTVGVERVFEDDPFASSRASSPSVATRADGIFVVADPGYHVFDGYAGLSSGSVTVHQVAIFEVVNHSEAACWSGGEQRWSVNHDTDPDAMALTVNGAPPTCCENF